MNEQLQSKLVEILTGIQSATKAAGDFAMEQLPDIAQSYVMYGRALHTTGTVVGLAMLLAMLWLAPRAKKAFDDGEVWSVPIYIFGTPMTLTLLLVNVNQTLLVWFAPKVWLLRELASLMK